MIAIVDYGVGNLFSLQSSLAAIGAEAVVTAAPAVLRAADKILLPGVGAFEDAAKKLRKLSLDKLLKEYASIVGAVSDRFNVHADVKKHVDNPDGVKEFQPYKTGETIEVSYKNKPLISYQLLADSEKESNHTTRFTIEVDGLGLANILVNVLSDDKYFYYEDLNPISGDDKNLIRLPILTDKEHTSQFDKVVEKHLKKMALHVGRDNYENI